MNNVNRKGKRRGSVPLILLMFLIAQTSWAQTPTEVTVRFANPTYNCQTGEYCVDVEYQADQPDEILYGMNVRFFYDDEVLEFIEFNDFQGGYDRYFPDPPNVNVGNAGSGSTLFGFPGMNAAVFVNGAIILDDPNQPDIFLPTSGWVKLYSMCFNVTDPNPDVSNFCPSLVWDLEEPPGEGGFLTGDDGVVVLLVDETGMQISKAADEAVEQFNWEYDGVPGLPYGSPVENNCISIESSIQLAITFTDNDVCGAANGSINVCGLEAGTYYEVDYTRDGIAQTTIAQNADGAGCILIDNLDAATYDNIMVTDTTSGCLGIDPGGPYVVTDPGGPMLTTITPTNPSTCGGSDGSIEICGLEIGTAYDIDYTRDDVAQTTINQSADGSGCVTIMNLDAAEYDDIAITEPVSGCSSTDDGGPYTLTDPAGPNLAISPTDPTTCEGTDGLIEICGLASLTSHDIDYTQDLVAQSTTLSSDAMGCIQLNGLSAGSYADFVVTDNTTGCMSSDAGPYILVDPNGPVLGTITASNPTSCNGSDGQIEVCGLTALNTYEINYWRNGVGQTSGTLQADVSGCIVLGGLDAATYSVLEITDLSTNCSTVDPGGPYELVDPNGPVLGTISAVDPTSCQGTDGFIRICGLNTGSAYTVDYTRNGSPLSTPGMVADIDGCIEVSNLDAATYDNIAVTESSSGCTSIDNGGPYTLVDPNGPVLGTISAVDPTSCQGTDGFIRICGLVTGDSYQVSYTRNAVPVSAPTMVADIDGCIEISNLNAGSYDNINVTDVASGCSSIDDGGPYLLEDPNGPTIGSVTPNDPLTCGAADGSLVICGLMVQTSYSVDYSRNGVAQPQASGSADGGGCFTIDGLDAATYDDITVTETVSGCSSVDVGGPYELVDPNGPTLTPGAIVNPSECDATDGSIEICGLGAATLYLIEYDVDGNPASTSQLTGIDGCLTLSGLGAGVYSNFVVTDLASGCESIGLGTITLADDCEGSLLGDFVWNDLDGDGVQDVGEPGIENVIVTLYTCQGVELDQTVTDANGLYQFVLESPGDYYLIFDLSNLPVGTAFTTPNAGVDDALDSDVNAAGVGPCVTVETDLDYLTYDAGIAAQTTIGDFVFHDQNANGLQDPGDDGIEGITVRLYNTNDIIIGQTETDANGQYAFAGVAAGDYYLEFIFNASDYKVSPANIGVDDSIDSDVDNSNGKNTTATFSVLPGENADNWDLGLYECIPVGDFVWFDLNANGRQDGFENGINGVRVYLYDTDDNLIAQDISGPNPFSASGDGYYKFCVDPGSYYIVFERPGHLAASQAFVGTDGTKDSDVSHVVTMYSSNVFSVLSGDMNCDIDGGFHSKATMGDNVWHDRNGNGIQDAGEPAVDGVVISAYNQDGMMFWQDVSDRNGSFYMDGLSGGDYYLKFDPPAGYTFTIPDAGGDDGRDSDVDGSNGERTTALYRVSPGEHEPDVDAGLVDGFLPVELLDFTAQKDGDQVRVSWRTAIEINNDYYEVERRHESESDFQVVGMKEAAGTSYTSQDYVFYDDDIQESGVYYYRLHQVDTDKTDVRSDVRVVEFRSSDRNISIYPNPAKDLVNVNLSLEHDQEVLIEIQDEWGRTLDNYRLKWNVRAGGTSESIQIDGLPSGIYNLKVVIDGEVDNLRFTKIK